MTDASRAAVLGGVPARADEAIDAARVDEAIGAARVDEAIDAGRVIPGLRRPP